MKLDTTTKSIQIFLGGSVSTNQLDFVGAVECVDYKHPVPLVSGICLDGTSNNTTAVTVVAAPATAKQIITVKALTVHNADTASATVTVSFVNGSNKRVLYKATLATLECLVYTEANGFRCFTTAGSAK